MSVLCALVFLWLNYSESANILGVFPSPAISHQSVFQPIWRELSLRGHQVTVITTNPLNDPTLINLTEIDVGSIYETQKMSSFQETVSNMKEKSLLDIRDNLFSLMFNITEAVLSHPQVQDVIQDDSRSFGVMLVEFFFPTVYALSARFKCPMIGIATMLPSLTRNDAIGNPSHPVLHPDISLHLNNDLNFYERLLSIYYGIVFRYEHHHKILPDCDRIARKYISSDIPYLGDIEKNFSLVFLSFNQVLHRVRPNVPALIELGTMHIKPKQPLPKVSR